MEQLTRHEVPQFSGVMLLKEECSYIVQGHTCRGLPGTIKRWVTAWKPNQECELSPGSEMDSNFHLYLRLFRVCRLTVLHLQRRVIRVIVHFLS
jgi:hypothetical protein